MVIPSQLFEHKLTHKHVKLTETSQCLKLVIQCVLWGGDEIQNKAEAQPAWLKLQAGAAVGA